MVSVKNEEWLAIILAALLIFMPLIGGIIQNSVHNGGTNYPSGDNVSNAEQMQGWLALFVSILTLLILGFQTWIYLGQRELMIRQAEIMSGQLEAAKTAADAAKEASGSLVLTERAFLALAEIEFRGTMVHGGENPGAFSGAQLRFGNYGKTPANIKELRFYFRALDHEPCPQDEMLPNGSDIEPQPTPMIIIGAKETWTSPNQFCWDQEAVNQAHYQQNGLALYVWGKVIYKTVFPNSDGTTTFKLRYDRRTGWIPIGEPHENQGN
jgi:hypothetical protein